MQSAKGVQYAKTSDPGAVVSVGKQSCPEHCSKHNLLLLLTASSKEQNNRSLKEFQFIQLSHISDESDQTATGKTCI